MKLKRPIQKVCLAAALTVLSGGGVWANQPDSLFIYTYATPENRNQNGLHCAWSADGQLWKGIGPEFAFVKCDYGRWGTEKRMLWPFLIQDRQGVFHALWSVNERDGTFAHASSEDLINWKPQAYPQVMMPGTNCLQPEAFYDPRSSQYMVTWLTVSEGDTAVYACLTPDFKKFSSARIVPGNVRLNSRKNISSLHPNASGTVHKVSKAFVNRMQDMVLAKKYKWQLYGENARSDAKQFENLKPLQATLTADTAKKKEISPLLMGVFFEDLSRAADGGLYAELIQNRDFEYDPSDREGRDKNWNSRHSWNLKGENATFEIATENPIHTNNPHYAVLKVNQTGAALINEGFERIPLKKGEKYNFSFFAKQLEGKKGKFQVSLVGNEGQIYATTTVSGPSSEWKKYKTTLTAKADATDAVLEIKPLSTGTVALDMISLFPQKTYKGRENGLRADLAQTIADLHPRFVRFPGGCVAHGDGIGNIYRWKNTIGPLEARKPQRNLWGYHQTAGLGYHEYFLFCEDLNAEAVPVLAAGVPCQNSACGGAGQQGGIPMDQMDEYVQDILDLIEYANGDAKTTKWGKVRAEAGHPKPFNLKYIGIGNEDLISDVFEERFEMIYNAIKKKHPEIIVIGTVGPFYEGSDYEEGWEFATRLEVPIVDEHYYESPGWFIHNQDYYDGYDRTKPHVYLGEYASRGNTLYNALAEAAYLCGIERNGDVVEMTSYAPLLAKEGNTNWNPDLIYFNNTEIKPTVNYYVQQLFGQNNGAEYIGGNLTLSDRNEGVAKRVASSIVRAANGDLIVKLVNILPTTVTTRIELPEAKQMNPVATKTTLSGQPEERNICPTVSTQSISDVFDVELPAYSFTVIRIKK